MASLAGTSVPSPSGYSVDRAKRGAAFIMADGSLRADIVNSSAKKIFAISWSLVTAAQLTAIETGYDALATATGTWTDHHGDSYTVTQDELSPLRSEEVNAVAARYNVSMTLREV